GNDSLRGDIRRRTRRQNRSLAPPSDREDRPFPSTSCAAPGSLGGTGNGTHQPSPLPRTSTSCTKKPAPLAQKHLNSFPVLPETPFASQMDQPQPSHLLKPSAAGLDSRDDLAVSEMFHID